MKKNLKQKYIIEYIERPGLHYPDELLTELVHHLRACAQTCFVKIPEYQVLRGNRQDLSDVVLAVAWTEEGKLAGFCSTLIINVQGIGDVQHLGLTCIRPEERKNGLTHKLTSKAVSGYYMRYKMFKRLWITNCAAVLSSLGNVALYFEQVYPSPYMVSVPGRTHYHIAHAIDKYYRDKIFIDKKAVFNNRSFVFQGSIQNTCFQKSEHDSAYYHRNSSLNSYYKNLMNFENGDEVLQVGFVSMLSPLKHVIKHAFVKKQLLQPVLKPQ